MTKTFMRIDEAVKNELKKLKEKDHKKSISVVVHELVEKNRNELKKHIKEARK